MSAGWRAEPMLKPYLLMISCLLLAPATMDAQGCSRTSPSAEEELVALAATFSSDPESAIDHGPWIPPLAATDSTYVVGDDSTYQAVLDVVIPAMRTGNTIWAEHREGDYTATVFRLGPYYAVVLLLKGDGSPSLTVTKNADGSTTVNGFETGRNPFVVLRATDLEILRIFF